MLQRSCDGRKLSSNFVDTEVTCVPAARITAGADFTQEISHELCSFALHMVSPLGARLLLRMWSCSVCSSAAIAFGFEVLQLATSLDG